MSQRLVVGSRSKERELGRREKQESLRLPFIFPFHRPSESLFHFLLSGRAAAETSRERKNLEASQPTSEKEKVKT